MNLHSEGQSEYKRALKKQQELEIKAIEDSELPKTKKANLIQQLISKFRQLIQDSDDALFLEAAEQNSKH